MITSLVRVCLILSLAAAVSFEAGCISLKKALIVSAVSQSKSAKDILDLHVKQIDLRGYKMEEALQIIALAIERRSKGALHFAYATRSDGPVTIAKNGKNQRVIRWSIRNPAVQIAKTETTLRAVIDDLCTQSGWRYVLTPSGYDFIDDKSYAR